MTVLFVVGRYPAFDVGAGFLVCIDSGAFAAAGTLDEEVGVVEGVYEGVVQRFGREEVGDVEAFGLEGEGGGRLPGHVCCGCTAEKEEGWIEMVCLFP